MVWRPRGDLHVVGCEMGDVVHCSFGGIKRLLGLILRLCYLHGSVWILMSDQKLHVQYV